MTRARGQALQLALARYLRRWWPYAESQPNGRRGTDILGTPGIVWECKTADSFNPVAFVRQSLTHTAQVNGDRPVDWPVTVYFPRGCGEMSADGVIAMMPLKLMCLLLVQAGYGADAPVSVDGRQAP